MELSPGSQCVGNPKVPEAKNYLEPETKTPRRAGAFTIDRRVSIGEASGALGIDLGVVALGVPPVDDVVDRLDVALGVKAHLAEHGVPLAGLDGLHHLLRIGRADLRHRL